MLIHKKYIALFSMKIKMLHIVFVATAVNVDALRVNLSATKNLQQLTHYNILLLCLI